MKRLIEKAGLCASDLWSAYCWVLLGTLGIWAFVRLLNWSVSAAASYLHWMGW